MEVRDGACASSAGMMTFDASHALLRRERGARSLPCGCLVGHYETPRHGIVLIVDAVAPDCAAPSHRVNAVLSMIGVASEADAPSSLGEGSPSM